MADSGSGRLSDADVWRCVERTVHDVLLPAIQDEWARATAVQLVGLVRYAAARPPDPTDERVAELAAALASLRGNPCVDERWDGSVDEASVHAAVGAVLAAAVTGDEHALAARAVLRPIVVRQLDDELAVTAPLVAAFRGQL